VRAQLRTAAEVAAWWAVLTGAYAVTLSVATVPELVVGAGVAVGCAALAVAARRAAHARWSPRLSWVSWLLPLPGAIAADSLRLFGRLLRGRPGGGVVRLIAAETIGEPPDRAAFRRAYRTVVLSASPGSVVLDWPADGSPLVLHELGRAGR
jgi:hypothetical protein